MKRFTENYSGEKFDIIVIGGAELPAPLWPMMLQVEAFPLL